MNEVISDLYDIAHPTPTPVSLKKLSAIAVSLEIWRREVNEHRKNQTLARFAPRRLDIPWKTVLPGLPSVIYDIIYEYVKSFGYSLDHWIYHCGIIESDEGHQMNVLQDFDDFVCDCDGDIHYIRTAEPVMRCHRVSDVMKFNIACAFCLEDYIRRMWPLVSTKLNVDSIDFKENPDMYYWICRLTNTLDKIKLSEGNVTVAEEMLDCHCGCSRCCSMPSLEYFWNAMSRESQIRKASKIFNIGGMKTFITTILPILDNQLLNELLNERGCDLMRDMMMPYYLLGGKPIDVELVLRTWFHIRNIMNGSNFKLLVAGMLKNQCRKMKEDCKDNPTDQYHYLRSTDNHTYLCFEIWTHSPPNLKSSVIEDILQVTALLKDGPHNPERATGDFHSIHVNVELLLLILRCASVEKRSSFWHNYWLLLITAARAEELRRIMDLCFETKEHEIAEFKEIMARNESVRRLCVDLLREGEYFDHLNELVSFIRPEMHNARIFKHQILRSLFFGTYARFKLEIIMRHPEKFIDFVSDANTAELSVEFENQLMSSSSSFLNRLWHLICNEQVSAETLIKFINAIVSDEETVSRIKMYITDSLKKHVTATRRFRRPRNQDRDIISKTDFTAILKWCLGSNEEVEKFKLTCA